MAEEKKKTARKKPKSYMESKLSNRDKIEARKTGKLDGYRVGKWSDSEKVASVEMYLQGKTNLQIAKYLQRRPKAVTSFINNLIKGLMNTKQSRILGTEVQPFASPEGYAKHQQQELIRLRDPDLLNQPFLEMLSPDDPNAPLTDAEVDFCWTYVSTDNYEESIKAAKLDVGLYSPKNMTGAGLLGPKERPVIEGYKHCLALRATYLKRKSNVQHFIHQLRDEAIYEPNLDKDFLQKQILIQIHKLREMNTVESAKLMKEYISMLGKSVGGFIERKEIGVIDHSTTLDRLHSQIQDEGTETIEEMIERKKKERDLLQKGVTPVPGSHSVQ